MSSNRTTKGLAGAAVAALAAAGLPLTATATAPPDPDRAAAYTPKPTTLAGASADGPAFDLDEHQRGDLTVQVKDQRGKDLAVSGRAVHFYWWVTPFDGSPERRWEPGSRDNPTFTDSDGRAVIPLPDSEPGYYELHARLSGDPATGAGPIGRSIVLTFRAGQARVAWRVAGPQQALVGTAEPVPGRLVLEDGTGLPGRRLNLAWTAGTEADPAGAGDAALVRADGSPAERRQVTTGSDGGFFATVQDPAESPQPVELGGLLSATAAGTPGIGAAGVAERGHGVDFVRRVPVGSVSLAPETALSREGQTPGRPVSSAVTVLSASGARLPDQQVTLTTDHGFFTPYAASAAALTPATPPTAGADAGAWQSLGRQVTVRTDGDGVARFSLAIERDPGFDDDGRVRATVTAAVASPDGRTVSDTEPVDWTTADPLNGGRLLLVPVEPPDPERPGQAAVGDRVRLDVVAEDQFGNPVAGETVRFADDSEDAKVSPTQVTTDLDATGDLTATATAAGVQRITAAWTARTATFTGGGSTTRTGTEQVTAGHEITWYATGPAEPAAPERIVAVLRGRGHGAGADRLRVRAGAPAGTRVKLFVVRDGRRVLLRSGRLDWRGAWRAKVADRNGGRRTTYVAKVVRTDTTTAARSNRLRLR